MKAQTVLGAFDTSRLLGVWHDWKVDSEAFLREDLPKIILVVVVAIVLTKLLRIATGRLSKYVRSEALPAGVRERQLNTLAGMLNSVGIAIIVFLAAMQILSVLGINMGPLLASAGVAGLAIGIGAQTLVKDVINGFFILMENQYDLGDTVRIAGVTGTVEAMSLRRTTVRAADGTLHIVPNSEIKIVSNLTRDWTQVALHVAVSSRENSNRVVELLRQAGNELRNDPRFSALLVGDPQLPGVERMAVGEVDYLMLVKTRPGAQYEISRELQARVNESFASNHIHLRTPARADVQEPPH